MILRVGVELGELDEGLVKQLEVAEHFSRLEFEITSGYRSEDPRCHGQGKAVDIACKDDEDRYWMLRGLLWAGFYRIGLYSRHIHVDMCEEEQYSQDILWLGGASK